VDDKNAEAFAKLARKTLKEDGLYAIEELRKVIRQLERPPDSEFTVEKMQAYLGRVRATFFTFGCYDVPANTVGDDTKVMLPWGYTTIAGINALKRAHENNPANWSNQALEVFKKAANAWPYLQSLWRLIKRVYPECEFVRNDQFAPDIVATTDKDLNCFYTVFSNFFDDHTRYEVFLRDELGGNPSTNLVNNAQAQAVGAEDYLDIINSGYVDSRIVDFIQRPTLSTKSAEDFGQAYTNYIERIVRERIDNSVGAGLSGFFAKFIEREEDLIKNKIGSGILTLTFTKMMDNESSITITKEMIEAWKHRKDIPEDPERNDDFNDLRTYLSFHKDVWKGANSLKLNRVGPSNPLFRLTSLTQDTRVEFARSHMTRGGGGGGIGERRKGTLFQHPFDQRTTSITDPSTPPSSQPPASLDPSSY